ncbi:hypothetical protein F5Y09DRAFT_342350 [Xylaria sp. FL1042]|nr:hypothetical protein F5Y09DRAFT_342350 [Xylaria sp. FL1042]
MFCLFLAANALFIAIGFANDTTELIRRLGQVAVINLVPTFLGAHMNHVANACGFYYERYVRLHTWLAGVVIVLYTVLAVKQTDYDGPSHYVTGILASSSFSIIIHRGYAIVGWMERILKGCAYHLHTIMITEGPLTLPAVLVFIVLMVNTLLFCRPRLGAFRAPP